MTTHKCGQCGAEFQWGEQIKARIVKIGDPLVICSLCFAVEQVPRLSEALATASRENTRLQRALVESYESGMCGQVSAKTKEAYDDAKEALS